MCLLKFLAAIKLFWTSIQSSYIAMSLISIRTRDQTSACVIKIRTCNKICRPTKSLARNGYSLSFTCKKLRIRRVVNPTFAKNPPPCCEKPYPLFYLRALPFLIH